MAAGQDDGGKIAALEARIAELEAEAQDRNAELSEMKDWLARIDGRLQEHIIKCPGAGGES